MVRLTVGKYIIAVLFVGVDEGERRKSWNVVGR